MRQLEEEIITRKEIEDEKEEEEGITWHYNHFQLQDFVHQFVVINKILVIIVIHLQSKRLAYYLMFEVRYHNMANNKQSTNNQQTIIEEEI